MEIPRNIITALDRTAYESLNEIALLVDHHNRTNNEIQEVSIWSNKWDAIERSLKKHKTKYSLLTDTFMGVKLKRKVKPRRHNKRKLQELEYF